MNYDDLLKNARINLQDSSCKACTICNGRACLNKIPGPGAKGEGYGAIKNYDAWKEYSLVLDTISDSSQPSTSFSFFGYNMASPIFVGPIGAVANHYNKKFNDISFNKASLTCAKKAGIIAFTGDGLDKSIMTNAISIIKENCGIGIPTIKPWDFTTMREKIEFANKANPVAIACDIDAAGLPFLKNSNAGPKTVAELREIISLSGSPFIVKGIMSLKGALKAYEAGAKAIVVSNHGGRVLDEVPSTASVLEEISKELKGKILILVDGGIRSGRDIFKALALGADACTIARPYVTAIYGDADEGVNILTSKLEEELTDTMLMCGAKTLKDINRNMIRKN